MEKKTSTYTSEEAFDQLLGNMDKGSRRFCGLSPTGMLPKIIPCIHIYYGLIIMFSTKSCTVQKLVMDFVNKQSSVLYVEVPLSLEDGLNRLIVTMEQQTKKRLLYYLPTGQEYITHRFLY